VRQPCARKAVIVATGGSTGNVNFRRMFDPRLTEEYCGLAGMPYSDQDASGEIAAMAINASLWGLFNFTSETGSGLTKPGQIGCQYGYVNLRWMPGSPVFGKARASGLRVTDWQNVITVNMLGKRFYDETGRQYTANNYKGVDPYSHGSYLNAKAVAEPEMEFDDGRARPARARVPGRWSPRRSAPPVTAAPAGSCWCAEIRPTVTARW